MDMKFLEKVAANRFDLFVVMKETKQNKTLPLSAHIGIKGSQGHYIWYQSESYNART